MTPNMPNIKSVKKDVKKSRELHLRNVAAKSKMKTYIKKSKTLIEAGDATTATLVAETVAIIDKAAKRGIIHKNAAARRKSRLMKRMAKASASA